MSVHMVQFPVFPQLWLTKDIKSIQPDICAQHCVVMRFHTFASISSAFSFASCSMKAIMCLICGWEQNITKNKHVLYKKKTHKI